MAGEPAPLAGRLAPQDCRRPPGLTGRADLGYCRPKEARTPGDMILGTVTTRARWAVAVWVVVLLIIGLRAARSARPDGVYPIFSTAGRHWLAGEAVYVPPTADLDVFRYSPPVAAFFAPWSLLPDRLAGILWRGLNAAVFLGGLAVWCSWQRPRPNVAAVFLLVIPLAIGGLNNGQCNAL